MSAGMPQELVEIIRANPNLTPPSTFDGPANPAPGSAIDATTFANAMDAPGAGRFLSGPLSMSQVVGNTGSRMGLLGSAPTMPDAPPIMGGYTRRAGRGFGGQTPIMPNNYRGLIA